MIVPRILRMRRSRFYYSLGGGVPVFYEHVFHAFNRTRRQYLRHLPTVPASPANSTCVTCQCYQREHECSLSCSIRRRLSSACIECIPAHKPASESPQHTIPRNSRSRDSYAQNLYSIQVFWPISRRHERPRHLRSECSPPRCHYPQQRSCVGSV